VAAIPVLQVHLDVVLHSRWEIGVASRYELALVFVGANALDCRTMKSAV
jgi:hypothetical protein